MKKSLNKEKPKIYKCIYCGIKTYNPKKACVLCESGITKTYNELIELCKSEKSQKISKKAVAA